MTGAKISSASALKDEITCATFDVQGRRLMIGGGGGEVVVFNFLQGLVMGTYPSHASSVSAMSSCAEDKTLVTVGWDRSIHVYDQIPVTGNGSSLLRIMEEAHDTDIICLAVSHSLGLIATGGADGSLKIWDYQFSYLDGRADEAINGTEPLCLCFLDPYPLLVVGDASGHVTLVTVRPWFGDQNQYTQACRFNNDPVGAATINGASGVSRMTLKYFAEGGAEVAEGVCSGQHVLYTGDEGGTIRAWDLQAVLQGLKMQAVPEDKLPKNKSNYNPRRRCHRNQKQQEDIAMAKATSSAAAEERFHRESFGGDGGLDVCSRIHAGISAEEIASKVVLLGEWQAHNGAIVTLEVIDDPPTLMSAAQERSVRMWTIRKASDIGMSGGVLTYGRERDVYRREPFKFAINQEKRQMDRLKRANVVLDKVKALEEDDESQHQRDATKKASLEQTLGQTRGGQSGCKQDEAPEPRAIIAALNKMRQQTVGRCDSASTNKSNKSSQGDKGDRTSMTGVRRCKAGKQPKKRNRRKQLSKSASAPVLTASEKLRRYASQSKIQGQYDHLKHEHQRNKTSSGAIKDELTKQQAAQKLIAALAPSPFLKHHLPECFGDNALPAVIPPILDRPKRVIKACPVKKMTIVKRKRSRMPSLSDHMASTESLESQQPETFDLSTYGDGLAPADGSTILPEWDDHVYGPMSRYGPLTVCHMEYNRLGTANLLCQSSRETSRSAQDLESMGEMMLEAQEKWKCRVEDFVRTFQDSRQGKRHKDAENGTKGGSIRLKQLRKVMTEEQLLLLEATMKPKGIPGPRAVCTAADEARRKELLLITRHFGPYHTSDLQAVLDIYDQAASHGRVDARVLFRVPYLRHHDMHRLQLQEVLYSSKLDGPILLDCEEVFRKLFPLLKRFEYRSFLEHVELVKEAHVAAVKRKKKAEEADCVDPAKVDELRQLFNLYDIDGSGLIDAGEVFNALSLGAQLSHVHGVPYALGPGVTEDELQTMMISKSSESSEEMHQAVEGGIGFEEFVTLMKDVF
ncbi:unnamed protein product [Chrysoparadoxa australica]